MDNSTLVSDLFSKMLDEAREQGREQGREEGKKSPETGLVGLVGIEGLCAMARKVEEKLSQASTEIDGLEILGVGNVTVIEGKVSLDEAVSFFGEFCGCKVVVEEDLTVDKDDLEAVLTLAIETIQELREQLERLLPPPPV